MKRQYDSYFTLRINGAMYGIWKDKVFLGLTEVVCGWIWEPVDGIGVGRYTPESDSRIQAVCDILDKQDAYAGLTPQQFVEQLLK